MSISDTVWLVGIILFFAIRHLINKRHQEMNDRIDALFRQFEGLREYLYEIDPQFDDERKAEQDFQDGVDMFSGQNQMELIRRKQADGKRILNTPFD